MPFGTKFLLLLVAGISCAAVSCGRSHASNAMDRSLLLKAVREYGRTSEAVSGATTESKVPVAALIDNEGEYRSQVAAFLVQKDFGQLEQLARDARVGKTRFAGGIWKLNAFYQATSEPIVPGANDADWEFLIATLKEWAEVRPNSVTPRVALADTYVKYADKARGGGYADTVSETGWKLDDQRLQLAASTLLEAARLKEKCPFWYEVMQQVALGQGWSKPEARELFDRATAFEPSFYHYYREYANFLQPKWYGEPGEAEALADDAYTRVPGPEGKFIYFEIASLLTCQCDSDDSDMQNLSWPKIQEGYTALGQLYGYSVLKRNRYAHMAVEARDKRAAAATFAAIGDDWDHEVWRSDQQFEQAKNWALSN